MAVWPDGDGVEFEWSGSGTGSVTAGLARPYRRLPSAANADVTGAYFIRHLSAAEWEQSLGTWSAIGQTLTRGGGPIVGSNSTNLVNFSAGTKIVAFVVSSDELVALNDLAAAMAYEPVNF